MTFNIMLFLLMMWYSQVVRAGLEPHALSVLCLEWCGCFVRCTGAFVSHKGQKVSNVTV